MSESTEDACVRWSLALMDFLPDYRYEVHIQEGMTLLDENGNEVTVNYTPGTWWIRTTFRDHVVNTPITKALLLTVDATKYTWIANMIEDKMLSTIAYGSGGPKEEPD